MAHQAPGFRGDLDGLELARKEPEVNEGGVIVNLTG
jgi:hypothetical protein